MNIPQIPDIEEIKRKMAEANMNFPEPVSYPDQLQAIRDLPPMTSNAHKRRNTSGNAKYACTPIGANITPAQILFKKINDILPQCNDMPTPKWQCKICQRQLLPLQACQSLICHKCNPLGFLNK
jgi:hypothetical protein